MRVVIPAECETLVKRQAALAGCRNVAEYLLSLVVQDRENRQRLDEFAEDARIEQLVLAGLDSGPTLPLDMLVIRREFEARIANRRP